MNDHTVAIALISLGISINAFVQCVITFLTGSTGRNGRRKLSRKSSNRKSKGGKGMKVDWYWLLVVFYAGLFFGIGIVALMSGGSRKEPW